MKRFLLITILVSGCTDENATRQTLESSGYTDIVVGEYDMLTCGKDDTTATKFTAKNPQGKTVKGAVCCGLFFKGCTVRF